jgi:N-acetylneuraminate synthase/sialic acid synthase
MAAREMVVDGVVINDASDVFVIAEIGQNHEGDIEKCKQLFDAAKLCGATSVKLQKRNNRKLYTRAMYDEPYNSENAYAPTYGTHREKLEFNREQYTELHEYAKKIGIIMFSTAWDYDSADLLNDIGMPAFKIASGDLRTIPLIKHIARFGKPLFVSTGGGTIDDVRRMYDAVMPINNQLCIMQCTSGYPPPFEELNIRVIETFRNEFKDAVIGFSSHDSGIAMALVGYMLGARAVEKHFTLNRAWKGTDQAFSLEPPGMRRLVRDLKRARISLGDGVKRSYKSEEAPLRKMGKKLVAARDLGAGDILGADDIVFKSPGDGVAPYFVDYFVGKALKSAVKEDAPLTFASIGVSEEEAARAVDRRRA